MVKILGIILVILGALLLSWNISYKTQFEIPFLSEQSDAVILGIGAVIVIIGVFFLRSGKKRKEVPVYDRKGKKVVGYRRTK